MHGTVNELIASIVIIVSIGINQVQAVTSVGGGEFSSPVTVSLREQPSDSTEQLSAPASSSNDSNSNTNQAGLIGGVTVSVNVLLLGLIVAAIIIFW